MATISSAGIGSGLDVNSIVTQLMAVERQPLNALAAKARTIDSKISAFGTLKLQLSTLSDAVGKLSVVGTWSGKTVTSTSAAVGATVSDGRAASAASFSVEVSQLARAQSVASAAFPAGAGVGSGTLTIQLGNWGPTGARAFAASDAAAVAVDVNGADTVIDIAEKINKAGAGVTATVLRDLSGERLLLRSNSTGEAAGFRVHAMDDGSTVGGPSLSALAFDDPSSGGGMAANPVQYGQNANATINGIAVSSASNLLADTVPGLSLTLSQLTTGPVEIVASVDTASMKGAIDAFVNAYNAMNQMLNQATRYDSSTRTAALLQGDSTTVGLQTAMRNLVGSAVGGGALQRLSDLGISIAKGGAGDLAVDGTRLDAALRSPDLVKQFFLGDAGASDSATGFATRFATFTKAAIGSGGTLGGRATSLESLKTSLVKDQDRLNDRLTLTEQRLRKQYTSLDNTMSSLTALNAYISQQVAQWNRSTS